MTKADFFSLLQTLSIEQLSIVHDNVLKKIQQIRSEVKLQKQQELDFRNTQKAQTPSQSSSPKAQPKMPSSNLNIKTMADNLDLDLTSIMREISKR
jgi:hypothetical protein